MWRVQRADTLSHWAGGLRVVMVSVYVMGGLRVVMVSVYVMGGLRVVMVSVYVIHCGH